jgi:hypothetical protein
MASREKAQDHIVKTSQAGDGPEIEMGRLDELEVDLDSALKEDQEYDYESEHSPFAEGLLLCTLCPGFSTHAQLYSPSGCS